MKENLLSLSEAAQRVGATFRLKNLLVYGIGCLIAFALFVLPAFGASYIPGNSFAQSPSPGTMVPQGPEFFLIPLVKAISSFHQDLNAGIGTSHAPRRPASSAPLPGQKKSVLQPSWVQKIAAPTQQYRFLPSALHRSLTSLQDNLRDPFSLIQESATRIRETIVNVLPAPLPEQILPSRLGIPITPAQSPLGAPMPQSEESDSPPPALSPNTTQDKPPRPKEKKETRQQLNAPASIPAQPGQSPVLLRAELLQTIQSLYQEIRSSLASSLATLSQSVSETRAQTQSNTRIIALSQKIDTLDSIQITNGITVKSGGIDITNGSIVLTTGNITADVLTLRNGMTLSSGTSTITNLTVSNNTTLGDAIGDLVTFNAGRIDYVNRATSTIPAATINAFSIATSTSVTPFLTFDTSNTRIGIATTTPGATFSVGGAGNLYALGGLGVGVATTTQGVIETSGAASLGGALSVSGILNLSSGNAYRIADTDVLSATTLGSGVTGSSLTSTGALSSGSIVSGFGPILINNATSTITNLTLVNSTSTQATSTFLSILTHASTSQLTVSTGLGIGVSTSTRGVLETAGVIVVGGSGTSTFANGIQLTAGCLRGPDNQCVERLSGGAANTVAFWTSATTLSNNTNFSFDNTNTRLGVGTSTPGALLSLATTASTPSSILLSGINTIYASSSTSTIPNLTLNAFSFATSTTAIPTFTISTASTSPRSGLIGIGTTSPTEMLSIAERLYVGGTGTSTIENNLRVLGTLQTGTGSIFVGNNLFNFNQAATTTIPNNLSGAWSIATSTNITPILTVSSIDAGRVGIGTSSPAAMFSIHGSANLASPLLLVATTTASGATSTALIIDSSGRLGIGTTSPSSALGVQGDILFSGALRFNDGTTQSSAIDNSLLRNLGLTTSVSANALTINLTTADGSTPSATNPVQIAFRSATLANGTTTLRSVTGATSLVISSGSTLGTTNATAFRLYIIALDNNGTVELAIWNPQGSSGLLGIQEENLNSSTAEGGAGAADSAQTLFSTTARTNVPVRILGYIEISETTAGTWATNSSVVQIMGSRVHRTGDIIQRVVSRSGTTASGTGTIPDDNTIPQSTEGNEFMTQAITPTSAINRLYIEHSGNYRGGVNTIIIVALFQDTIADALASQWTLGDAAGDSGGVIHLIYDMRAGTVSSTTFKIRAGLSSAGTINFNWSGARGGGTISSTLQITEVFQ